MKNIFDTKIASKIVRTYTDAHGLKNLVQEFCNKSLDKRQGSSDWNKDINDLSDKQLEYAKDDPLFFRSLMTPNHYAYIKIAEGCDNGCSF